MAQVSNVSLSAGRESNSSPREQFELTFDVMFSEVDRRLEMEYTYDVVIYEIDERHIDLYAPLRNGSRVIVQHDQRHNENTHSDKDDFIGWMQRDPKHPTLKAGNQSKLSIKMKLLKDVGKQERGEEEYKALILLNPTTAPVAVFSNTVRVNLG